MKQLILGYLENNCYLISSKDKKTLYIIDVPDEAEKIIECAEHNFEFEQVVILLTHAHADHIGAIKKLVEHFQIKTIYMDDNEKELYTSPLNAIMPWLPVIPNLPLTTQIESNNDFEVIQTPGHTKGGVCYFFKDENYLFSGDTLFYRSVGRTDLPGGSSSQLTKMIRERLFSLPENVVVYPGHGEKTTIGAEKKYNPYV